jgi:hypothetical protein
MGLVTERFRVLGESARLGIVGLPRTKDAAILRQIGGCERGMFERIPRGGAMRALFESVWAAVLIGMHLLTGPLMHRWRIRWGATPAEMRWPLPGDDLIPSPTWSYTHAITIDAPRSVVWPWLVQMGQARGGFYSYAGLENLVGCGIRNVEEIRPELQSLRVGDAIRMHRSGIGPRVTMLEPGRALVLGGEPDARGSRATWSFHLLSRGDGTTRLVERGRNLVGRGLLARLLHGPYVIDPIGFVMSRRMLRTIKRLAEGPPAPRVWRETRRGRRTLPQWRTT